MNKQRYLAELQRLLVFMTEEDRELTVHRYGEMFDAAGDAGELELVDRLGSPTKAAIQLSRGYEPGQAEAVLPKVKTPEPPPAEASVPVQPEPDLWEELPQFELPTLEIEPVAPHSEAQTETVPASEPEPEPEPEAETVPPTPAEPTEKASPGEDTPEPPTEDAAEAETDPAPAPAAEADTDTDTDSEPEPEPEQPLEATLQAYPEYPEHSDEPWRSAATRQPTETTERSIPLGVGIPLFVLVMVALGLPLAALCLGLMAALLLPGCATLLGAYLAAVGGLWCLSYVADAILMFGLAFLILALGLMILWLGIWADVKLAALYTQGVTWLSDELLGRKVTGNE